MLQMTVKEVNFPALTRGPAVKVQLRTAGRAAPGAPGVYININVYR